MSTGAIKDDRIHIYDKPEASSKDTKLIRLSLEGIPSKYSEGQNFCFKDKKGKLTVQMDMGECASCVLLWMCQLGITKYFVRKASLHKRKILPLKLD